MIESNSKVLFGDNLHYSVPNQEINNPIISLLGNSKENSSAIFLDEEILSKHVLMIGGIGTGKTNTFYQMLSQLKPKLMQEDTLVIFDTKGDFYDNFYAPGDIVISNDEKSTDGTQENYWNIFDEFIEPSKYYETALEISKTLFSEACEKTNQIFFPNAAKDLFMAILMHFRCSNDNSILAMHNKRLRYFINNSTSADIRNMLANYPELKAMSSYIADDGNAQTQGVISELQQVTREVLIGNFAKIGNIGIRNIINNPCGKTVFVEYDLSMGNMLTPIYSLLFDLAIKQALSRNKPKGNVYFFIDEFRLLPSLSHIDDAVNFGRSLGLKFVVGIQNVEQIYDKYGEERARSILSGFSTNISFCVHDEKSREYIQSIYGSNRKSDSFVPIVKSKGIDEQQREGKVVEDWNVSRLNIGEAIIGLPGQQPFVYKFDKYNK